MAVAFASEEMASTCHVEASSGSHVFKVAGYSLTQGMGVAASVKRVHCRWARLGRRVLPGRTRRKREHRPRLRVRHAGYARFMSLAEVESLGLVHGYCLAVRCMVRVR
ncbi:hypothetical protein SEVIR_5G424050v4 [Setaria viridis]